MLGLTQTPPRGLSGGGCTRWGLVWEGEVGSLGALLHRLFHMLRWGPAVYWLFYRDVVEKATRSV